MDREKINGDSILVFGTPIPDDKGHIDIPPKKAHKKVIEGAEIEISAMDYDDAILEKRNKKYGREDKEK